MFGWKDGSDHVKCDVYTTHKGDIAIKNTTIRKNITIPADDFKLFDRYSKRSGKTFFEFIRTAAENYIEILENRRFEIVFVKPL